MNEPEPNEPEAGGPEAVGPNEPPPILGTWPRVYAVVIAFLAVLIALFTWFTKTFE